MYIYYDEEGTILYSLNTVPGVALPEGDRIEVPEDTPFDPFIHKVVGGQLVAYETISDAARYRAQEEISRVRGELRARYITDLPGQDMVYLEKRGEALAFIAHENPTPELFPMVYAEVGITAPTAYEVAQVWINMNDMWRLVSTLIETATLKASSAVASATKYEEIDAILAEMNADLAALG